MCMLYDAMLFYAMPWMRCAPLFKLPPLPRCLGSRLLCLRLVLDLAALSSS